jgi:hypothetical protein
MRRDVLTVAVLLSLMGAGREVVGERTNQLSAGVNAVAGVDDNPVVSGLRPDQLSDTYYFNWGVYPTLRLESRGARSTFDLNYAFGLNRVNTDLDLDSESHGLGLGWQMDTGKWRVELRNQFRKSPDFTSFNIFQGILFTPQGVFFDYDTVAVRRDSYENTATLSLDRRLGAKSWLNFGLGHSLRNYERDERFQRRLADQSQFTGHVGWERELSARTTLDARYQLTHFDFQGGVYRDGRSHDLSLGLNVQLAPTVRLNLGAGPSYTEEIGGGLSFWGYNARVGITKAFETRFISAYYDRRNGASIGLGSLSRTQRLGFGFSQALGRRFVADFSLSLYETQRVFSNPIDLRGLQSSLAFSFELQRHLLFSVGASYTSQEENADLPELNLSGIYDLDRRRAWVSLRLVIPDLGRF